MEDSLMRVLDLTTARIQEIVNKAKEFNDLIGTCIPENVILEAEVNASKLESSLKKLGNDLNNYFRFVNEPAVDDISRITSLQLEAEEVLCEVRIKLQRNKPSTSAESTAIATGNLPKLSLPEYHGDVLQWHQFWDQFSSLVDSRRLSDVDKFLYLSSILRGEAKKLVEGLAATNENYNIAVAILKARYGRIELVKDAHYSALNKIAPASTAVADCRQVLNELERHFRVLRALGEDTTHSYFRFLILEKFPEDLVYELKKRTKEDSVTEIRKELEGLISAKEDASRVAKGKETNTSYTTEALHVSDRPRKGGFKKTYISNPQFKHQVNHPKRAASHPQHCNKNVKRKLDAVCGTVTNDPSSTKTVFKKPRMECVLCSGNHGSVDCYQFKTNSERRNKLSDRCYRCLKRGHWMTHCNFKKPCFICRSVDHTDLFCPNRKGCKRNEGTVCET
jgi:hypothetical protein